MNNKILAICDEEQMYARRLSKYLSEAERFPFQIHVFSGIQNLISFVEKNDIECLLVAQSLYEENLNQYKIQHIIILNETGTVSGKNLLNINKYQSGEIIIKTILTYYLEHSDFIYRPVKDNSRRLKVIGIYTPVGRSLQTTFSMTLGQILANKSKVLYLNFENHSGMTRLLNREFQSDLTDLLYFFHCVKEKFAYQLENIVENVNGMDFVPPVFVYPDLLSISGQQWIELLDEIEAVSEYEYLILDLSDHIAGLFDILRRCHKVFTITKEDSIAAAKLDQYNKLLGKMEYQDVADKTRKCRLPAFKELPSNFELLTYGELAVYIKANILKELGDE